LVIIIFGATGDLTKRLLMPGLHNLFLKDELKNVDIIGVGRKKLTRTEFVKGLEFSRFVKGNTKKFRTLIKYTDADLDSGHDKFSKDLQKMGAINCNKLFYLATPDHLFEKITDFIDRSSITNRGWSRIIYEKPFGHDLKSAVELNKCVKRVFTEKQIYLIDHFLGKEQIQNMLVLRFANNMLGHIWNRDHISEVHITAAETLGVETRAGFYDKTGVLRDMIQNHMLQIIALIAMEPPKSLKSEDVRIQKIRMLKILKADHLVLGQYAAGSIGKIKVAGYQKEAKLSGSKTPTFAALRFRINNNRWRNVPFYVKTGKRLAQTFTTVEIHLKDNPARLFPKAVNNIISFKIKPEEGFALRLNQKLPGPDIRISPVTFDHCHDCEEFTQNPTAYENLIHQAMIGDQTLFTSWPGVLASWQVIDPLLNIKGKVHKYRAGSLGPKASNFMFKQSKR